MACSGALCYPLLGPSMSVLFAVFVLCLVALVWTVVALRRHIREHDAHGSEPLRLESKKNEDPLGNLE
jgi:hypothetical protein